MTNHQKEVFNYARHLAEEQVLFLRSRYKMKPDEIVTLYTGELTREATYDEAVDSIFKFNMNSASSQGFLAS